MSIKKADISDLNAVKIICERTVSAVYPHYYPKGAVEFFLLHHSEKNISEDIESGRVYLCIDNRNTVGTVTLNKNEICRLFVLPEYQGKGFGGELLDFAENTIFESFGEITLSASFPAKSIYIKRGYKETEFNIIKTNYNDFLCYDTMIKNKENL